MLITAVAGRRHGDALQAAAARSRRRRPRRRHAALRALRAAAARRRPARTPRSRQTLAGWLQYVGAVTTPGARGLGGDAFDVEIWNELSFGSDFLERRPPTTTRVPAALQRRRATSSARSSSARSRSCATRANGVAGVGIGDGFASETPWPSGRHRARRRDRDRQAPVPAGARLSGTIQQRTRPRSGPTASRRPGRRGLRAFFPEYWLSGLQTETLIRDLSPVTTYVYGTPHGRHTAPARRRAAAAVGHRDRPRPGRRPAARRPSSPRPPSATS